MQSSDPQSFRLSESFNIEPFLSKWKEIFNSHSQKEELREVFCQILAITCSLDSNLPRDFKSNTICTAVNGSFFTDTAIVLSRARIKPFYFTELEKLHQKYSQVSEWDGAPIFG